MAKKIKKPLGPYIPESVTFSKGKERKIEFTLYPKYMEIRVVGLQGRYHITYEAILLHGVEQEVRHRIRRGAI